MKILVTTASWKSALAVMISLARQGHEISLIGEDPSLAHLHSKYCHQAFISPHERNKEAYINFILDLLSSQKFDLIIPISDSCIEYFSQIREKILTYTKLMIPSKEQVELARNKANTYRFAMDNGIPIPKTFFPKDFQDAGRLAKAMNYPCVVKHPDGTGGNGNVYPKSYSELVTYYRNLTKSPLPVIQEHIHGRFLGYTAVCNKGEVLASFLFEPIRQYPEKGGITVYAHSLIDEKATAISTDLIKKLQWTGPIDLDYFLLKDGKFLLLEINPRFSGTILFAYHCGIDLPRVYLDMVQGTYSENHSQRKLNMTYRSIFSEEISSCLENRTHIRSFFSNFLRPRVCYDFSISDPKLLLWQIKNAKWVIDRHKKRNCSLISQNKDYYETNNN